MKNKSRRDNNSHSLITTSKLCLQDNEISGPIQMNPYGEEPLLLVYDLIE